MGKMELEERLTPYRDEEDEDDIVECLSALSDQQYCSHKSTRPHVNLGQDKVIVSQETIK